MRDTSEFGATLYAVDDVTIDFIEFGSLKLGRPVRSADGIYSFSATLEIEAGEVHTYVTDPGTGLATLFRNLADSIGGFDGEMSYESLDGQLSLSCVHDGIGTVNCELSIARLWPPSWRFSAQVTLGAGTHIERIADDVECFVAGSA